MGPEEMRMREEMEEMEEPRVRLEDFLRSRARSAWLSEGEGGELRVFARKASRVGPEGGLGLWLDIANLESPEESRGRGAFRAFLGKAERLALEGGFEGVWIENVINPRLEGFFGRAGYARSRLDEGIPSFAKSARRIGEEAGLGAEEMALLERARREMAASRGLTRGEAARALESAGLARLPGRGRPEERSGRRLRRG